MITLANEETARIKAEIELVQGSILEATLEADMLE